MIEAVDRSRSSKAPGFAVEQLDPIGLTQLCLSALDSIPG